MALTLNHFSVRTPDLDASRRFYADVLGLTVGPRPPFPFPGLWMYRGDHGDVDIAFFADGLKDMLDHLDAQGVACRQRTVPAIGLHQVFLDDPQGVVIELNYPAREKEALDA